MYTGKAKHTLVKRSLVYIGVEWFQSTTDILGPFAFYFKTKMIQELIFEEHKPRTAGKMKMGKDNSSHQTVSGNETIKAFVYLERLFNVCVILTSYNKGTCHSHCFLPISIGCITLFLLLCADSVRIFSWFSKTEILLATKFNRIAMSLIHGISPILYILLVRAFRKVPSFVDKINSVKDDSSDHMSKLGNVLCRSPAQVGKWIAVGSISFLSIYTIWIFLLFNLFLDGDDETPLIYPFSTSDKLATLYLNILAALVFVITGTWLCAMMLLILVTFVLCRKFRCLILRLRNIREQLAEGFVDLNCCEFYSRERLKFECLLECVDKADNILSPLISVSLGIVLFSICILIYNFLFHEVRSFVLITDFTFLSLSITMVIITLTNSVVLHSAVR